MPKDLYFSYDFLNLMVVILSELVFNMFDGDSVMPQSIFGPYNGAAGSTAYHLFYLIQICYQIPFLA